MHALTLSSAEYKSSMVPLLSFLLTVRTPVLRSHAQAFAVAASIHRRHTATVLMRLQWLPRTR